MVKSCKHYRFVCDDCKLDQELLLWTTNGIFDSGPTCKSCGSESLSQPSKPCNTGPYINTRFNFEKNILGQTREFFQEFKKRHGSSHTIKDY